MSAVTLAKFVTAAPTVKSLYGHHYGKKDDGEIQFRPGDSVYAFFAFVKASLVAHAKPFVKKAGGSISLLVFLLLIKVVLFQVLSQPRLHSSPSAAAKTSHIAMAQRERQQQVELLRMQLQGSQRKGEGDRTELERALKILEKSQDCSNLLRCLSYSFEVNVRSWDEREECKRSYVGCREEGLLGHLNTLLEALDETAA